MLSILVKKLLKMKTKYKGLSTKEISVIEHLMSDEKYTFNIRDISLLLGVPKPKSYNLIKALKKKKWIYKIGSNYILDNLFISPDTYDIVSQLVTPSYISFWTALHRYGFTEQVPYSTYVVTTKLKRAIKLKDTNILFVKFKPKRFFGYTPSGKTTIATKEKAIIDSLYLPKYAGGIEEIFKCIYNSWQELDKDKLIDYALKMKSKILIQRLGYLIECGHLGINRDLLKKLIKNKSNTYSKLDPTIKEKGEYNKKWNLIVNIKNLFKRGAIV